ncbi:MAG: hypothetical protein IKR22_01835 [Clostridiales bacterium]|nr:hypothetical protein [Clostridiales bacterium]
MADNKSRYSEASSDFVTKSIYASPIDMDRYNRSKAREAVYNETWKQNMVDINEVVANFAPDSDGRPHGVKYLFKGERYTIKADMAGGYLRIYDKKLKKYVKLNGKVGTLSETHYKIKKRSEMKK